MNLPALRVILLWLLLPNAGWAFAPSSNIERLEIEGRTVLLYVPAGYKPQNKYPLLIVNDGQTCFGPGYQSLELDKLVDSLIAAKAVSPFFIAAVYSNEQRMDDYIPYQDSSIFNDFGYYQPRANDYTTFLLRSVIPAVAGKYSLDGKTGIAGFSFGGLHAAWAALHYPQSFSFAAAFSPSMWVADYKIFTEANIAQAQQTYYLDIGTAEWNYYIPFIKNSNLTLGKNIFYYEVKDAAHSIYYVKQRAVNALYLFAGKMENKRYTLDIETEVIKSQAQPGRYYLRLNPVADYGNGLRFSLTFSASFSVNDEEIGTVNSDGSFVFKKPGTMVVTVGYNGKEKKVRLRHEDIERMKR
ncbi:MAG TPA: alpha/beta hydrolase-fold protein [Chitinophagaceae bacterium]|nr:alpha/beta hydrolase-fold protein [Chitinophagaceae bacterium]